MRQGEEEAEVEMPEEEVAVEAPAAEKAPPKPVAEPERQLSKKEKKKKAREPTVRGGGGVWMADSRTGAGGHGFGAGGAGHCCGSGTWPAAPAPPRTG